MNYIKTPSGLILSFDPPEPVKPAPPAPPPRVTICPDCGGPLEESWEHESRYTMCCRTCMVAFQFYTGWLGSKANELARRWPYKAMSHVDPDFIKSLVPTEHSGPLPPA
jgi:hypothetical protein